MASSFPPDVVIVEAGSLLHARFQGGRKNPQLSHLRHQPLPEGVFEPAVVTPTFQNSAALAESLRHLKSAAGKLDHVSILLPDPWFRIHLSDLNELPEKKEEADEMVRWTLRRSLPMRAEDLRIAYQALAKTNGSVKVLVLAAIEKTLALLEQTFREEGIEVALIEPIGLNIWNAIAAREAMTTGDRFFFYLRPGDFTTAVFRGQNPVFIRSRNLGTDRSVLQEIRLSASYLRNNLRWERLEQCYVAGNQTDQALLDAISQEFQTPVKRVTLRELVDVPEETGFQNHEAELAAAAGVFTA